MKICIALAVFKHDEKLIFDTDSLNIFELYDGIVSATKLYAYEEILSKTYFLDLKERIDLLTSSSVISKNTKEFDVLLVCCKGDDNVVGTFSSRRFTKLKKYLLKASSTFWLMLLSDQ